jgi:transcriptional regulator GlxA family with amidase domain
VAHEIALLALDDVVAFDLGVPAQIFGAARDEDDRPLYRLRTCTPDGGPVRTSAGFSAMPGHGPKILATADTVVVAGIQDGAAMREGRLEPQVADALARRRPDARLMSICTGAFVLTSAGVGAGIDLCLHVVPRPRQRGGQPRRPARAT